MNPRIVTLADLHRERCNLLIQCQGCQAWSEKTIYQLTDLPWAPGVEPEGLESITIASIVERLKCKRCGSREAEWWTSKSGAAMNDWYVEQANKGRRAE